MGTLQPLLSFTTDCLHVKSGDCISVGDSLPRSGACNPGSRIPGAKLDSKSRVSVGLSATLTRSLLIGVFSDGLSMYFGPLVPAR